MPNITTTNKTNTCPHTRYQVMRTVKWHDGLFGRHEYLWLSSTRAMLQLRFSSTKLHQYSITTTTLLKLLSFTPPGMRLGQRHKFTSRLPPFRPLSFPFTNTSLGEKANPKVFKQYSIINPIYINTKDCERVVCFQSEQVSILTAVRRF